MKARYCCEQDVVTKLWEIVSPSGHVLFESEREAEVREVCEKIHQTLSQEPVILAFVGC